MEYTNFEPLLNNVLEINSNNKTWDLHDDADFSEVHYDIQARSVRLIWNYLSKWFRNESTFKFDKQYLEEHNILSNDSKIVLLFEAVTIFEIKPRDAKLPYTEDDCLADIRNYYEDDKGKLYEDGSINFVFQSGMEIRIKSNSVTFQSYSV